MEKVQLRAMELRTMELIIQRPNKRIYRRAQDCVKLFNEDVPAADVLGEAMNQAMAQQAGLPVPCLREVTKLDGKWAIVYEYIEGDTLLRHMESEPGDPQWMELFVRLQMEVHDARIPKLQRQRDQLHRKISASGLDATARYELHTRLDAMHDHQKVCHGDFVPSNVILRQGSPFVIDWNHLTQGNASADAANSYLTMQKRGHAGLAASYLKLYCERSDTARQYVEKWMPIIAGAALANCPQADKGFYRRVCEEMI